MSNDAEAREVRATVTDSEQPMEPVNGDQTERKDRPDLVAEDDEVIDADAVIIAEDTGELDDLDEAGGDTHPDTVPAEAIVAEPVPAEATVAEPAEGIQMAGDAEQLHSAGPPFSPRSSMTPAAPSPAPPRS